MTLNTVGAYSTFRSFSAVSWRHVHADSYPNAPDKGCSPVGVCELISDSFTLSFH